MIHGWYCELTALFSVHTYIIKKTCSKIQLSYIWYITYNYIVLYVCHTEHLVQNLEFILVYVIQFHASDNYSIFI